MIGKDSSTLMDKLERAIVIVHASDWVALYVEGRLKMEGHSFTDAQLISVGQENPTLKLVSKDVDDDWMKEEESFPDDLREVRFQ